MELVGDDVVFSDVGVVVALSDGVVVVVSDVVVVVGEVELDDNLEVVEVFVVVELVLFEVLVVVVVEPKEIFS